MQFRKSVKDTETYTKHTLSLWTLAFQSALVPVNTALFTLFDTTGNHIKINSLLRYYFKINLYLSPAVISQWNGCKRTIILNATIKRQHTLPVWISPALGMPASWLTLQGSQGSKQNSSALPRAFLTGTVNGPNIQGGLHNIVTALFMHQAKLQLHTNTPTLWA